MSLTQKLGWLYSALFVGVVAIGYIPPFTDSQGYLLGLFKIELIDDLLHLGSGIWAAIAAWHSFRASRFYFRVFGVMYGLDGVVGLITGLGYLDLGIFLHEPVSLSLQTRIFANLPHIAIGGTAALIGFVVSRRSSTAATLSGNRSQRFMKFYVRVQEWLNAVKIFFRGVPRRLRGFRFRKTPSHSVSRWVVRGLLAIGILLLIVFAIPVAGLTIGCLTSRTVIPTSTDGWDYRSVISATVVSDSPDYRRDEESTYLTLPEWYIVYSAQEYADVLRAGRPSQFPYFASIGQYWRNYCHVYRITKARYTFNKNDHLVLAVIGTSFTIENAVKGIYENTLGRLSEWLSAGQVTPEDRYAHEVAQHYASFLHEIPWYNFPFSQTLGDLWTKTNQPGQNLIRKWERRSFLSAEFSTKAVYGWVIRKATGAALPEAEATMLLWIGNLPDAVLDAHPDVKIIRQVDSQTQLIETPRYDKFTALLLALADHNVPVFEIAGNDEILLTAIAPTSWKVTDEKVELLFAEPVLTQTGKTRFALRVPVTEITPVIRALRDQGIAVEHFYDY